MGGAASSGLHGFAVRLRANQDLKQELKALALAQQIPAGCIVSAIGSLKQVAIRFANQPRSQVINGKFEILSLSGTLSMHGMHLHIAIADNQGRTIGGHLDHGCLIYTTAEIVIAEMPNLTFLRSPDSDTGFLELDIRPAASEAAITAQSVLDAL